MLQMTEHGPYQLPIVSLDTARRHDFLQDPLQYEVDFMADGHLSRAVYGDAARSTRSILDHMGLRDTPAPRSLIEGHLVQRAVHAYSLLRAEECTQREADGRGPVSRLELVSFAVANCVSCHPSTAAELGCKQLQHYNELLLSETEPPKMDGDNEFLDYVYGVSENTVGFMHHMLDLQSRQTNGHRQ